MPTLPFEAFQYQKLFLQSGQFSITIKDNNSVTVKEYNNMPNQYATVPVGAVDWSYSTSTTSGSSDNWGISPMGSPTMDPQSQIDFYLKGRINTLEAEISEMKEKMKKLLSRMPLEDQKIPGRKLDLD